MASYLASKHHVRRQAIHTNQEKFVSRNMVAPLLAILILMGLSMHAAEADLNRDIVKPYPAVKLMPSYKIDFSRDWESYSEKNKEAIKDEYMNLFMGKYAGDTDKFLSEGKDLFQQILRDFDETRETPFKKELEEKGVTGKPWIDFGAKLLCSWENSWKDNLDESNRWQNYVDRDEIIELCLAKDTSKVICKENGDPGIFPVNCNDRIIKGLNEAFEWYRKNGVPNIVENLRNNGACIFAAIFINSPGLLGTFDEYGVVYMNNDDYLQDAPDKAIPNLIKRILYRETMGAAHLKLFALFGNKIELFLLEAVKEVLSNESFLKIYEETGDRWYLDMGESAINEAEYVAGYTHSSMEDNDLKANVDFMKKFGIVESLSSTGWD